MKGTIETRYGRWAVAGILAGFYACIPLSPDESPPDEETAYGEWRTCECWGARMVYPEDDGIIRPGDAWVIPTSDLWDDEMAARVLAIAHSRVDDEP